MAKEEAVWLREFGARVLCQGISRTERDDDEEERGHHGAKDHQESVILILHTQGTDHPQLSVYPKKTQILHMLVVSRQ